MEGHIMASHQHIGKHEICVENDVVLCRYHGAVSIEEIIAIHTLIERQMSVHGRLFQLCDLSDMDDLNRDVRAWIAKWSKEHRLAGLALFGGSLVVQVAATMIERVARLLHRSDTPPVYFCRTEAEARAWLEQKRQAASPASAAKPPPLA
jgi:hypothetical protein